MLDKKNLRIGDYLCQEGLITEDQLLEVLDWQKCDKRKLGQLLLAKGLIDEIRLTKTLATLFQLPFVQLDNVTIDERAVRALSYEILAAYKVIPFALQDNCLTVATTDPLDVSTLQEIQYRSGYMVNPVMASASDIDQHLREFADSFHTVSAISAIEQRGIGGEAVVHLVDSIIDRAIEEKASDIHFQPQRERLRVRFRIDGVLYDKKAIPKELERNVLSRVKVMAGMDIAENRRAQDGRTSLIKDNQEYDIRLSTIPDILGENLVLRVLNKNFAYRSFDALGMDRAEVTIMDKLIHRPNGLILVTGPTGAGKTTTLYSILNILNQTAKNIISIEDPVEYEMAGITQTAINTPIGYTFVNAMRHILRHDPDIIMVGEIRDVETADMAIRASLTGHLVLSTIHTNTAAGAITRLLEMGIEPFLISSAVSGVIAERLVRKLCPYCQEEYNPAPEVISYLGDVIQSKKTVSLGRATGCERCLQTGYQGRIGIFELLSVDENIRGLILRKENENVIARAAISKGMNTLRVAGLKKALEKITSLEEVMGVVSWE